MRKVTEILKAAKTPRSRTPAPPPNIQEANASDIKPTPPGPILDVPLILFGLEGVIPSRHSYSFTMVKDKDGEVVATVCGWQEVPPRRNECSPVSTDKRQMGYLAAHSPRVL